jgi:hypothetical protein
MGLPGTPRTLLRASCLRHVHPKTHFLLVNFSPFFDLELFQDAFHAPTSPCRPTLPCRGGPAVVATSRRRATLMQSPLHHDAWPCCSHYVATGCDPAVATSHNPDAAPRCLGTQPSFGPLVATAHDLDAAPSSQRSATPQWPPRRHGVDSTSGPNIATVRGPNAILLFN